MEGAPSDTELYAEQAHRLVDNVIESALQKLEAEYGGFLPKEITSKGKCSRVTIQYLNYTIELVWIYDISLRLTSPCIQTLVRDLIVEVTQ